ncbi:MAG: two-component regulator propeller domain-containing protein [Bacteroidales bacterium]
MDDGLVGVTVTDIYQDHQGFIWLATDNGLSRFDGYEFRNYQPKPDDPGSLHSGYIRSIYEDHQNLLWIGTNRTLERFNRHNEEFELMFSVPDDEVYVSKMYEDTEHNLWIGTHSHGLLRYKPRKDTVVSSEVNSWYADDIQVIYDITEDDEGYLWLATTNGIYKLDIENHTSEHFSHDPGNPNTIPSNNVYDLEIDYDQTIWIATYGSGICNYDPDKNSFTRYKSSSSAGSLSSDLVRSLLVDSQGHLWVISESGLDLFQREKQTFRNYHHIDNNPNSLVNNKLWCIYEDRQQNIWLGHYLDGVSFSDFNTNKPFYNLSAKSYPVTLNNKYVNDIIRDHQGKVWIGTDGGGINVFDESKDEVQTMRYSQDPRSTNVILDFLKHSNGNIYLGTYLDGMFRYKPKTGTMTGYKHSENVSGASQRNDVRDMAEDESGNIWTVTYGGGVNVFDPKQGTFIEHYGQFVTDTQKKINSSWLFSIYIDSDNIVWLGSVEGLTRLDPATESIHYKSGISGLESNTVYYITSDRNGKLLLATNKGLCIYERENDSVKWLKKKHGLAHNVIRSVAVDKENNYWITTFKGLSKYLTEKEEFINFYEPEGISGNQFQIGASYLSEQGRMYLGTTEGMTYFSPQEITIDSLVPSVHFTSLKIFNRQVKPGDTLDGTEIMSEAISETDTVFMNYQHRMFTLGFAALDYTSPEKVRYKYKLEGFDETWIKADAHNRVATYTNLDPGTYTFKVLATNSDGIWASHPTTLTIDITPPFWLTLWFKILIVAFFILLLTGIYYYRVRQIKRLNEKLARQVEARTSEIRQKNEQLQKQAAELNEINAALEERQNQIEEQDKELKSQRDQLKEANEELRKSNTTKDRFFSIVAHDLKNPVNSLLGFSSFFKQRFDKLNDERKYEYIDHLHFASRQLYNLLENLLTWAKNQQGQFEFHPRAVNFQNILEESLKLIKSRINEKNIEVVRKTIPDLQVYGDFNMLYAVIRNLLSNAVKFTPENGEVTIETIMEGEDHVRIAVSDTGMGIPDEVRENLFRVDGNISRKGTDGEKGSGLGLIICKEFLEKHDRELFIETAENQGTTFYFYLPVAGA